MNLALAPQIFENWTVKPATEMELKEADCIVAFSFGQGADNQPGAMNEILADITNQLHVKLNLPVMAQWEIAKCLPFKLPHEKVVWEHRKKGKYLDSFEVASQFAIELLREPLRNPICVAKEEHLWRCLRHLEKVGFKKTFAPDTSTVPFDADSVQDWTRNLKDWKRREIKVRAASIVLGYI